MDPIKAVGHIDFNQVNWPVAGVSLNDLGEDSSEGLAKLHGLLGCQGLSVLVDPRVRVVNDGPGAPIVLRYHASWANMEVGEMLYC